jgi:hypothetical protein
MLPTRSMKSPTLLAVAVAALLGTTGFANAPDPVARFTAFAVNLGGPGAGRAGAGTVELVINRWSTAGERDRLMAVLKEKGPEKLLDALTDIPRVGYIRTPDSLGYDLRFAYRELAEDGGDDITVITDRYIGFWESFYRPRTIDYPFTVIELHLNRDGEGEGKMSLATRITADRHGDRVVLENYAAQPVLLQSVRRAK